MLNNTAAYLDQNSDDDYSDTVRQYAINVPPKVTHITIPYYRIRYKICWLLAAEFLVSNLFEI